MQEGTIRLVGLGFSPFLLLILWHKIVALFVTQHCSSSFLFDPEETERQQYPQHSLCTSVCRGAQWDSWLVGFPALAGDESASERFVLLQRCCTQ